MVIVAGLVLASGESRRFGRSNKLLAELGGETIVRRTVRAYAEAGLDSVAVVVGFQAAAVAAALDGLGVKLVPNPDYSEGQSAALRHGIAAVRGADAALIGVADQPFLTPDVVRGLAHEWRRSGARIVAPRYAGRRGNPVLFSSELFDELEAVRGDVGGRPVITAHPDMVTWVDVDDARIGADVDSPEEYRHIRDAGEA